MRREAHGKTFKYFSFVIFSIFWIVFYVSFNLSNHFSSNNEMISADEFKTIVIEFEDPEKKFEVDEEFLEEIRDLDLEELSQRHNETLINEISSVTKKQHNLVVAGWRTGSTLTGDILKSYPRSFYHYEPFLFVQQELEKLNMSIAKDTLKDLFLCNYTSLELILDFNNEKQWPWTFNSQVWSFCNAFNSFCKNPKFLSTICKVFPVQIIKTVRVTLNQISPLLDDSALNLKIVLLVRDPRAVMNSRAKQNWCLRSDNCMNSEVLCHRMEKDYYEAKRLQKLVPDRIQVLRYEDLVSWPHRTTKNLYDFFGMEMTKEVIAYLNMNTISQVGRTQPEIAAMLRRHGAFYSHWLNEMEFEVVLDIQKNCEKAMELFGYRTIDNWTEKSSTFEPLAEFVF